MPEREPLKLILLLLKDSIKQQKMSWLKAICLTAVLNLILMLKILKYSVTTVMNWVQPTDTSHKKMEVLDYLKVTMKVINKEWFGNQITRVETLWWTQWTMEIHRYSLTINSEHQEVTQEGEWGCHIKTWAWTRNIWRWTIWQELDH